MADGGSSKAVAVTVVGAGVIGALYYGQAVVVPLALALFLTFLLSPIVRALGRLGLGRVVAILVVGVVAYTLLGAVTWIIARQGASLVEALPEYRANIRAKIADIRLMGRGGSLERLRETVQETAREAEAQVAPRSPASRTPAPVVVARDETWSLWTVPAALGPWLTPLATGALVAVLVPFMLFERVYLIDKLMTVMGRRRLAVTTRALDEAAERVSRFLLMQTIVNGSYGVMVAIGLFFIGLPYAVLWGFLAAVFRFIPYVGPWIAAILPVTLALAVFDGWARAALVTALFIGLELFSNMVLETVLYAGSAGVSQVGLLVAVAFWTAIWGPIGLVLAMPLTVCLVIFGRHVPELRFLVVFLSEERMATPDTGYYQRLLADDEDEASAYLEEYGRRHPEVDLPDTILLPALQHARRDRVAGAITVAEESRVVEAIGRTAEQLDDDRPPAEVRAAPVMVLGCPALDRADEVALQMLARRVASDGIVMEVLGATLLTAEVAGEIAARAPNAVVVGSLPPGGLAESRYLCKRLQAASRSPWVLVGRWGRSDGGEPMTIAGATAVVGSLAEARAQLAQFARIPRGATAAA